MPVKNKIGDLRNHLFETIEMLKDPESGMDVSTAKTIAEIGQVIINSAKVEVDFQKHVGGIGTDFIENLDHERKELNGNGNVH